jgi:23S rRNA (uracil1939-C5)-methyltransferase
MTFDKQILTITKINSSGEGVAFNKEGKPILVPFTLPGEVVEVTVDPSSMRGVVRRGSLERIIQKSPQRQEPPCPYFGICGGCQLQHLNQDFYKAYKRGLVEEAFHVHKLAGEILDPLLFGPNIRRRINFKAIRHGQQIHLGYHRRRSHEVVDIDHCPLLLPEFNTLLQPLKLALLSCLKEGEEANVFLTKVNNGFDGAVVFDHQKNLSIQQTSSLIEWATNHHVIKLILKFPKGEDLVVHQASPQVIFSGVSVLFPAHAFLQTSETAEAHMVSIVLSLLPKSLRKIADLFSGLGTFSFPLARHGHVEAFESDFKAVQYLNLSAEQNKLSHVIRATQRDLFKYPLSVSELNLFDVVVLDPPRAGALNQIKSLAGSMVKTIIMISCNTNTFARDAQLLVKNGYKMQETHLVDQFLWSPHIELISSFVRC